MNGGCLVAPHVLLVADSVAGLLWRVDLDGEPRARVWLAHDTMKMDPHSTMKPPQPGINGVRFARCALATYFAMRRTLPIALPLRDSGSSTQ